jgi:outer membrane protein OmpA-like peptidoglycan-associated protein
VKKSRYTEEQFAPSFREVTDDFQFSVTVREKIMKLAANVFGVLAFALTIAFALTCRPARADWPDSNETDKLNKWFDNQKGKTHAIQAPRKIQKLVEIQVPRGMQAIKKFDTPCELRFVIGADALFDSNEFALSPQAEITLKALGPMLEKESMHPVIIEAHTDSIGFSQYNQQLSEKRAASVYTWLSTHSFIAASAKIKGFGKTRPIASNLNADGSDNPAGRQQNRRVEIIVDTCHNISDNSNHQ